MTGPFSTWKEKRADARAEASGKAPPEPTDDELIAAVLAASRALVALSARSLAEVDESLTLPQLRMLVILDSQGATNLSRLAENLTVNPSAALRMAERLIAAGVIERTADPVDRRAVLLRATQAGRRVVRRVTEARRAAIRRVVSVLPDDRRAAMIGALRTLAEAAGEPLTGAAKYAGAAAGL